MKILSNYENLSIHKPFGLNGDCAELAIKDFYGLPLEVSKAGIIDIKIKIDGNIKTFNNVEIKTGAGRLLHDCKGNKYMIYIPVVDRSKDILHQEGFLIKRTVFINLLKEIGLYRACKQSKDRAPSEAIQTFWIEKNNAPHGKKYYLLLDELYEKGMPLQEFLIEQVVKSNE